MIDILNSRDQIWCLNNCTIKLLFSKVTIISPLLPPLQFDLSHENEIVEKFGTRLIVSHVRAISDRCKLCTVYWTELVNLFWWSLYFECTSRWWFRWGEFYGFFEETRGWFVDVYVSRALLVYLFECNGTIKIRFVQNWLIVFKKIFQEIIYIYIYLLYIVRIKLI